MKTRPAPMVARTAPTDAVIAAIAEALAVTGGQLMPQAETRTSGQ